MSQIGEILRLYCAFVWCILSIDLKIINAVYKIHLTGLLNESIFLIEPQRWWAVKKGEALFKKLNKHGIRLSLHQGRLKVDAPEGAFSPDLRQEIIEHKQAVISFLKMLRAEPEEIPKQVHRSWFPLSHGQRRLWFSEQLAGSQNIYNMHVHMDLSGPLSVFCLVRACVAIIERHHILRVSFSRDPELSQRVRLSSYFPRVLDLGGLPKSECEATLNLLCEREQEVPFDLEKDSLLRVNLIRLGETRHCLLVTMHHIIADAWSMGIFSRELALLYESELLELPNTLGPLKIQYTDYAAWQVKQDLSAGLAFWKQQLEPPCEALILPERSSGTEKQARDQEWRFQLSAGLGQAIERACQAKEVTHFMFLQAAWLALLFRDSQQREMVMGVAMGNRSRAELEPLIGFFVNLLALRFDFDPGMQWADILEQVRMKFLEVDPHRDVPFEEVVKVCEPNRQPGRNPLFRVLFSFQERAAQVPNLPGLTVMERETQQPKVRFDLTLLMERRGDGYAGRILFDGNQFADKQIAAMANHYKILLAKVTESNPRLGDLQLLDQQTLSNLQNWSNGGHVSYGESETMSGVFEHVAAAFIEEIALEDERRSISLGELNQTAERWSRALCKAGLPQEGIVALAIGNLSSFVTASLATWKAGGCIMPLDLDYPQARLQYMLRDAAPVLLLYEGEKPAWVEGAPSLDVAQLSDYKFSTPRRPLADQAAYLIYTSGSTGKPKGTIIAHRGYCNLARVQKQAFNLRPGARVLQFAARGFDAVMWELAMGLGSGATVCAIPSADRMGQRLHQFIQERRITHVTLPPAVIAGLQAGDYPEVIISAGEACSKKQVAKHAKRLHFVNAYGPTETTVCSSFRSCSGDEARSPIGKPFAGTSSWICDTRLKPMPVGITGQLMIGGINLARGYLGKPGLTAARFVPDPFSGTSGARLYMSGDACRWNWDGELEFQGRIDDQVKLRGQRIEPGEIAHELRTLDGVSEAFVLARKEDLVAFVVTDRSPSGSLADDERALRQKLVERLPAFMVPGLISIVRHLPLNAHGKVDRVQLTSWAELIKRPFIAPETPLQKQLAAIWAEVLRRDRVGLNDDFFELGGHSLLAIRVQARIEEQLGVTLDLKSFFRDTSLSALVEMIQGLLETQSKIGVPVDAAREDQEELVL